MASIVRSLSYNSSIGAIRIGRDIYTTKTILENSKVLIIHIVVVIKIGTQAFRIRYRHRFFFHSPEEALIFARRLYPGDPWAEESALLHLKYDSLCTDDQEFKHLLEFLAKKDSKIATLPL